MIRSSAQIGAGYMVLAMISLSLMDALVKQLSADVSIIQIVWLRFVGQSVVLAIVMCWIGQPLFRTENPKLHILRAISILIGSMLFFTSFARMELADATALIQIGPIMVSLGAVIFLGEVLGLRRWIGIICAFIGTMIIVRPGSDVFTTDAMLPLLGTVAFTIYALVTRFVRADSAWILLFLPGLFGAIFTSFAVPFFWEPISSTALLMVLGVIITGFIGNLCMIRAFTTAEASVVAPIAYIELLFAVLWGYLFFDDLPEVFTIVGAVVIVGSGLYVWYRDKLADKQGSKHG